MQKIWKENLHTKGAGLFQTRVESNVQRVPGYVPDTQPKSKIIFNTRSEPNSSGISSIEYKRDPFFWRGPMGYFCHMAHLIVSFQVGFSALDIFPHCLGFVLVHYPVSRLVFLLNMASCHFSYIWAINHPFSDPPGPGMTPGWGIKVPKTSFPIAWGVFWPIIQFPGGL